MKLFIYYFRDIIIYILRKVPLLPFLVYIEDPTASGLELQKIDNPGTDSIYC